MTTNAGFKIFFFFRPGSEFVSDTEKTMHSFSTAGAYLEHSQTSKMELIVKIEQLTIFAISSILDVQLGSDADAFDAFDTDMQVID